MSEPVPKAPAGPWFNEIAAFLGEAYWAPETTRVQAFTTGTEQEVDFLVGALALEPGQRVLDAGCGPGRHSLALARRGIEVVGVDLSPDFVALATASAISLGVAEHARFEVGDLRTLSFDAEFDAVICLCQGGFGLLGGGRDEGAVLERFAQALRPGGRLAVIAFNAYFAVRYLEAGDTFDAARGVNHERATLAGRRRHRARVRPLDDLLHAARADAARRGGRPRGRRGARRDARAVRGDATVDRPARVPVARAT